MSPDDTPPLLQRLVRDFGAEWVDQDGLPAWSAAGGDRVLLLAGDPVRFPEGQDVAAVLPEIQKSFPGRLRVGVATRADEAALARRYSAPRWPSLLFFRDGDYVTAIGGMQDWDVFLRSVAEALAAPPSRVPGIGIPVVAAQPGSC